MEAPYLVLGLDPGIASCGFCLIDMNNHSILEIGSHLFDTPREDKTKVSLAVARRNARSTRRNLDRTQNRLKHCLNLLIEGGLVPAGSDKKWMQSRKGDKPILKLRAKGLDAPLTNREFAQVLYTLTSRRGYIPHGEGKLSKLMSGEAETTTLSEDSGKVLKAVSANTKEMAEHGWRTVGEMLFKKGSSRNKGGNYEHCVLNEQIVDEAHKLFEAQRKYGNELATEELEKAYIENLTWEKETLSQDARTYQLVGSCTYFPGEKRAAQADLSSELCRAYERLGHVVIIKATGEEQRLDASQIKMYLDTLFSPVSIPGNKDCKVRYSDIRRNLDLSGKDYFKGISAEEENKKEPFEPKTWRSLRRQLPEVFYARLLDDRDLADAIGEALTYASTDESLREQLEGLPLSYEELDALLALPYSGRLFKGYGSRSLKALNLLLDCFEEPEILTLTDAERASGLLELRNSDTIARSTLLMPYEAYDPTCNNPVVMRAMARMRKIVNAIIRRHGVPNEIHIELGRELKQSAKEKKQIEQNNRKNEADRKRWQELIAEILKIDDPNEVPFKLVRKCIMREEQGEMDAYTGEPINLERLVQDDHYCEIDHVLPYSRTCDDSRNNKVLVLASSNQNKKERTPYEWMTSGEASAPSWAEYRARVISNQKYGRRKRDYLLNQKLDDDEQAKFIARNLNDTRYMAVAVKDYLENCLLFPEDGRKRHVTAVAGGATATLRHLWGMNTGDNNTKDREDDRHHAVDAAIIAACNEAIVKKVASARSLGKESFKQVRQSRLADTQPWPTFAIEVMARREFVIPTRFVSHSVTGRAFEETAYRYLGTTDDKKKLNILRANGKEVKKGNVVIDKDGSARLVDGMAFIRLWLDTAARKGKGAWLFEPVYYADLPAMSNGTYVPKACTIHVARTSWTPIPVSVLETTPLTLFRGDVLCIDGNMGRFWSFGISNCTLELLPLAPSESVQIPTQSKWTAETQVRILQEDCLGHCHDSFFSERVVTS